MRKLSAEFVSNIYNKNMTYYEVIQELKSIGINKKDAVIHLSEIAIIPLESARSIIKSNW